MFYKGMNSLQYSSVALLLTASLLTACGGSSSDSQPLSTNASTNSSSTNNEPTNSASPQTVSTPAPQSIVAAPVSTGKKRILPLGDSITQGGNGHPSYRRNLAFILQGAGYNVDFVGNERSSFGFDSDHEGHWGWEAGELEQKLSGWLNNYTPDIVLLHAGTNDVSRGQSYSGTIGEIGRIIDTLRKKNSKVVILLAKIIPMRSKDTADFNQHVESLAASKNTSNSPVIIVDQYSGYSASSNNYDNYHPNASGEEKMARKWFNALRHYL